MAILKIRDANGNVQEIQAIKGAKGDTGKITLEQVPEKYKALVQEYLEKT